MFVLTKEADDRSAAKFVPEDWSIDRAGDADLNRQLRLAEPAIAEERGHAAGAEAARRICEALRAAGIEVWFDQSELRGQICWNGVQHSLLMSTFPSAAA